MIKIVTLGLIDYWEKLFGKFTCNDFKDIDIILSDINLSFLLIIPTIWLAYKSNLNYYEIRYTSLSFPQFLHLPYKVSQ